MGDNNQKEQDEIKKKRDAYLDKLINLEVVTSSSRLVSDKYDNNSIDTFVHREIYVINPK